MNSPFCNYLPPTFRPLRGEALGACRLGVYGVQGLNGLMNLDISRLERVLLGSLAHSFGGSSGALVCE